MLQKECHVLIRRRKPLRYELVTAMLIGLAIFRRHSENCFKKAVNLQQEARDLEWNIASMAHQSSSLEDRRDKILKRPCNKCRPSHELYSLMHYLVPFLRVFIPATKEAVLFH